MNTKMISTSILTLTAMAIMASASAQLSTQTTVEFLPKKARYARGETITARFTVRYFIGSGTKKPLANAPLMVGDWFNAGGWTINVPRTTDANGQCTLTYRIPTNPNWDNIYIVGNTMFPTTFTNSYVSLRIPIGR